MKLAKPREIVDGGEQYLPYARQKLEELRAWCKQRGMLTAVRRYLVDSTEIFVRVSHAGTDLISIGGVSAFGWGVAFVGQTGNLTTAGALNKNMTFSNKMLDSPDAQVPLFTVPSPYRLTYSSYGSNKNIFGLAWNYTDFSSVWVGRLSDYGKGGFFTFSTPEPPFSDGGLAGHNHYSVFFPSLDGKKIAFMVGYNIGLGTAFYVSDLTNARLPDEEKGEKITDGLIGVETRLVYSSGLVNEPKYNDFQFLVDKELKRWQWIDWPRNSGTGDTYQFALNSVNLDTGVRTRHLLPETAGAITTGSYVNPGDRQIVSTPAVEIKAALSGTDSPWTAYFNCRSVSIYTLNAQSQLEVTGGYHSPQLDLYRNGVAMASFVEPGYSFAIALDSAAASYRTHGGVSWGGYMDTHSSPNNNLIALWKFKIPSMPVLFPNGGGPATDNGIPLEAFDNSLNPLVKVSILIAGDTGPVLEIPVSAGPYFTVDNLSFNVSFQFPRPPFLSELIYVVGPMVFNGAGTALLVFPPFDLQTGIGQTAPGVQPMLFEKNGSGGWTQMGIVLDPQYVDSINGSLASFGNAPFFQVLSSGPDDFKLLLRRFPTNVAITTKDQYIASISKDTTDGSPTKDQWIRKPDVQIAPQLYPALPNQAAPQLMRAFGKGLVHNLHDN